MNGRAAEEKRQECVPQIMKTTRYLASVLCLALFTSSGVFAAPETFRNPILPGYHPDPSIVRVGDDYYMVNSTFEWFPGMPIHHSKDLVNWNLIGHGLHRPEQLLLQEGLPDYMGIFAVTIRHHDGLFYLITTCVRCERGGNFYVTASNPAGPWSDPVWLDSPGIDPSLMWDDDGKAYYVGHGNLRETQEWPDQQGVWLQELDIEAGRLVGPRKQLSHGHANNAVWAEGPHLYKINGKYLLMLAEGGTGSNHAVTVHHSDDVFGPYVADMVNPVLTHRHLGADYPIHSIGHADLVQTRKGDWWAVMLGKRYVDGYTLLARETFLTPVRFEGQRPIFNPGVGKVLAEQQRPDLPWHPFEQAPARDDFTGDRLDLQWNMLRTPLTEWHRLDDGSLVLETRPQTLDQLGNPSLLARRIRHHAFSASLELDFGSDEPHEKAGMVLYRRSTCHYQFLRQGGSLVIIRTERGESQEVARVDYPRGRVRLRAEADGLDLRFSYAQAGQPWTPIGGVQSMTVLSFETADGFNGPYVGMYTTSDGRPSNNAARFDWFEYEGSEESRSAPSE